MCDDRDHRDFRSRAEGENEQLQSIAQFTHEDAKGLSRYRFQHLYEQLVHGDVALYVHVCPKFADNVVGLAE